MNLNVADTIELPLSTADSQSVIESGNDLSTKTISIKRCIDTVGDSLFVYLINLSIHPQFDFSDCDYEDKVVVFKQWLNLNSVYNQKILVQTLYQLVVLKSGGKYTKVPDSLFTKKQMNNMLQDPQFDNIINYVIDFICSSPLIYIEDYPDIGIDVVQQVNSRIKVDYNNNVPVNSALLFNLPEILDVITNSKYCLTNFVTQYNRPIYNGTTVAHYIPNSDDIMNICKNSTWIDNNTYSV